MPSILRLRPQLMWHVHVSGDLNLVEPPGFHARVHCSCCKTSSVEQAVKLQLLVSLQLKDQRLKLDSSCKAPSLAQR